MTALARLTTPTALALVDTYWISVAELLTSRGCPYMWSREYDDGSNRRHSTCGWLRAVRESPDELHPDVFVRIDDADLWTVGLDFAGILPEDLYPTRALSSLGLYAPASRAYRRTQEAKWLAPKLQAMIAKGGLAVDEITARVIARIEYRTWRHEARNAIGWRDGQACLALDPNGDVNALHEADVIVTLGSATRMRLFPNKTIDVSIAGREVAEAQRILAASFAVR